MKGDTAMKKLDLISDEYIREAEIPEDLDVIVTPKRGFWKGFARFMNSPVGVAMLCAVVSLSVLFAVVMAGQNGWGEPDPSTPAGSFAESESRQTNHETEITLNEIKSKDHVPAFYQALKDQGMLCMIPGPNGQLIATTDPMYLIEEDQIFNVTPPEIYEATRAMIFDAGVILYLWHDGEIYILNHSVFFGSVFVSAVLCDYDLNGTDDIFCSYITSMSGVYYTDFVVFDISEKALRHNLHRTPSYASGIYFSGIRVFCDRGIIQKRHTDGADYYDVYLPKKGQEGSEDTVLLGELYATLIPTPEGLAVLKGETEISPPDTAVPTVLSRYLDAYGFVGKLSESDFVIGVLSQFSYEGQPLSELPITSGSGELPDGGFTSTIFYAEEHGALEFGYTSMIPTYTNERSEYGLRTQTALEGFALPYGMVFGESLEEALKKLNVEISTPPVASGETLLYQVGNKSLCLVSDREATVPYRLVFKETVTSTVSAYRSATVERTLTLSFEQDLKLFEVKIDVTTQYATATLQDPDIGVLSPAVVTEIKQAFLMQNVPEADQAFYSMDDLSIRYYGTYNGGYAVFVDGIFDYNQAFEYETVLGIEFEYSSEQKLLYYKNGQFYALPEAASTGLLSQTDIERLYLVYTGR